MNKKVDRIRKNMKSRQGFSLVEVLVALTVLSIAMLGALAMVALGIGRNASLRADTTAANVAQAFLEDIASAQPDVAPAVTITDCTGAVINISTAGPAVPGAIGAPVYTPLDAPLPPGVNMGDINFTQAGVPGYQSNYVMCAPGGVQVTYDVRWRIDTTGYVDAAGKTWGKLVTVAALRRANVDKGGGNLYSAPVTLRSVVGM